MVNDNTEEALAHIREMFARGEFEKLTAMVRLYDSFMALGTLGRIAKTGVIWLAAMVGGYYAFSGWIDAFIKARSGP